LLPRIAFLSEILPIFFYLCFFKRNKGEGLGVIFLYCCISWLTEPTALNYLHVRIPDYIFDSGFTFVEFTIFFLFIYTNLQGRKLKYIPLIGALIFYPIAILNFIKGGQEGFDSVPASLESVLIISYCILLLYEQINDPKIIFVYNTKKFWVIIAFFLYFSSTLFLFLVARNFTQTEHEKYWAINNFFEILKNILLSISFIMKKRNQDEYPIDNLNPDI
jgi:hypothetical protein